MAGYSAAIQKLEFDKVLERISQLAVSETAKHQARSLLPLSNRADIELETNRVSQAKELIIAEGSIPLDGIKNIITPLKRTVVENHVLIPRELLDIGSTLRASRVLSQFLSKRRSLAPELALLATDLYVDKMFENHIEEALDDEGSVRDSATKELEHIRREIAKMTDLLRRRLESILKRVSEKEFVQEEIITTRDARMVIPVKVEHKNHVPGFIHSSSTSGATVFIEPAETLELNNGLRELQFQEQREIERILSLLTNQVRDVRVELTHSLNVLTHLDVVVAKASYSIQILGHPPRFTEEPRINLTQARHPVLLQRHDRAEVIPLDLQLGGDTRTLVITGPNAGGKSVTLKTLGLLALCAQAGIHIPASPDSELGIFDSIFVDIGDDQSIENDLSTFSSHLLRLKEIVEGAGEGSLVLIDEIGAATDPAEGGALAAAVLVHLTQKGAVTVATTHHGTLKVFAHQTPGMINGSMEFDQHTLKPTYRFRAGVPGSSYALELATRMELPASVIKTARLHLGDEKIALEKLLVDLEAEIQLYRRQAREASADRNEARQLVEIYESKMREIKNELRTIRRTAAAEARQIIQNAQALVERSIKDIRESQADKKIVRTFREELRQFQANLEEQDDRDEVTESPQFAVGDIVRLRDGSANGEVVDLQKDMATVLWDAGRLRVHVRELVKEKRKRTQSGTEEAHHYVPEAKTDIDLRGLFGDEAVAAVQSFLDSAYVAGLHRVDIIHGKGTGALRKRVTEFLKNSPRVKSFRLGEWNEGGSGVTVVELQDH